MHVCVLHVCVVVQDVAVYACGGASCVCSGTGRGSVCMCVCCVCSGTGRNSVCMCACRVCVVVQDVAVY